MSPYKQLFEYSGQQLLESEKLYLWKVPVRLLLLFLQKRLGLPGELPDIFLFHRTPQKPGVGRLSNSFWSASLGVGNIADS